MILCSGCFDGLHSGHVRYLAAAHALAQIGEPLWVAVAPDSYIVLTKNRQPRWSLKDRILVVKAVRWVDHVIEGNLADVILAHVPRFVVKGIDWYNALPDDVTRAAGQVGATICFVNTDGQHTSATQLDTKGD